MKITCLHVCKDTLWVGTSTGIVLNVKIPHVNNTTTKLNTILNFNGKFLLNKIKISIFLAKIFVIKALNHGHVGPVRFISSVEIPKQQQQTQIGNKPSFDAVENTINKETLNISYKTVVISGGEGFEEYKSTSTLGSGVSLSNSNMSGQQISQANLLDIQGSMVNSLASQSSMQASSVNNSILSNSSISSNCDEFSIGKEDLVNYVLTWEI